MHRSAHHQGWGRSTITWETTRFRLTFRNLGLLRNGSAKLADGRQISGVKVVEVLASGPATKALDSHKMGRFILDGALFVTAAASVVFFPPALIGVLMLAHSHVGESYDLVIAVDGYRVRNALDLVLPLRQAQSGDVVYMVVRNGHRHQVSIQVR